MIISRERILAESQTTGFRPDVLEKVIHLLNLLERFNNHPFLKDRLALKGGTALNLFVFDLPRLSVDIDLNYIGSPDRDTMILERDKVEKAIRTVCSREGMNVIRNANDHAGGKWRLQYSSAISAGGNIEIDLNYMFRVPFWPIINLDAKVGSYAASHIPVLDLHELAAGKLAALFARNASRDLFDVHYLLKHTELDRYKLRLGFVLYGTMNRKDWRTTKIDDLKYDPRELRNQLVPVVRAEYLNKNKASDWGSRMIAECRGKLDELLPMTTNEIAFLDEILDNGQINPQLLTADIHMAERIKSHPLLQWKALNVRQHKGL